MTLHIAFDNSYARLPDRFAARQAPAPVARPSLLALNDALAQALGLDPAALRGQDGVAVLAGNAVPPGADPLAMAYAGHQFGGWVPQLGDGRAVLLGEVVDTNGARRDIVLKGAGRTPFSRGGDGRAWLGPVLREYLVSEAMHALGIPTTRALAAVATGETVLRETVLPGAVLTRVAASHVRVGTFQYFAARRDEEALRLLTGHVIARHYPGAADALELLDAVVAAQARLIAAWMAVGFVHGVMNTDNMSVAGETIDYGPCAFLDTYDPGTVFSAIDQFGRYAYDQQPAVAGWNLAQFATCLLPLIGGDDAVERATGSVRRFGPLAEAAMAERFAAKIGLATARDGDGTLVGDLLALMAAAGADFTATFRELPDIVSVLPGGADWHARWSRRLAAEGATPGARRDVMRAVNPAVIPRNHQVEAMISAAVAGDMAPFDRLLGAVTNPFADEPDLSQPPGPGAAVTRTFCGT